MTNKEILNLLKENFDDASFSTKHKTFTVRKGFFYSHGMDCRKFEDRVKEFCTTNNINGEFIDRGERFVAFRGGATIKQGSHWWTVFKLKE